MRQRTKRFLVWLGALLLDLILIVPFLIGVLFGVLGCCVLAFRAGFLSVYEDRR